MKIKIGNFNFIFNMENKLRDFIELQYKDYYFWLDGKEDSLYVTNISNFEKNIYRQDIPEYEKELKSKYKIISIYREITKQVNLYIDNKVEEFFKNRNYSKYELYKNIELRELNCLKDDSKFKIEFKDEFMLDIDKNKINVGNFQLNPYTEKIDNLDDVFEQGIFNKYIKAGLILKEIEKGIAPPYIYELNKINNFLQDKKSVNLIFKDCEKFKCEAIISYFLRMRDNKFELNLNYNSGNNFKKENPLKKEEDLKLEDLKGISYGKKVIDIDGRVFTNINNQIVITLEDRLKQKVDFLKKDIKNEYYSFKDKMDSKYVYVPYNLEDAINRIKENKNTKEKIEWHNKELDQIIYKKNLVDFLEQAKTIEDIKDVCVELGDNELQNIYYGMLYEEENCECEEEEENY